MEEHESPLDTHYSAPASSGSGFGKNVLTPTASGSGCGSASTLKKRWLKSAENVENRGRSAQQKLLHPKAGRWIRQWTHVSLHFLNILTCLWLSFELRMEGPENKKWNIYISGYMWTGGPLAKISGPNPISTINLGFFHRLGGPFCWEAPGKLCHPRQNPWCRHWIRVLCFWRRATHLPNQNGKSVGDLWKFAFCKSIEP